MAEGTIGAGFRYIYYGYVNSDGFVIGNTATGATAGAAAGEPIKRIEGADTAPLGIPEDERTTVSGDDDPLVEFKWSAADLPSGVITTAVRDLDFEALALGTKVETIGDVDMGVHQPTGNTSATLMMFFQRRAKAWDPSDRGTAKWEFKMVPRSEITPLGSDWQQRTHNPYNYSLTTSKSDKKMWGATLTTGLNGTTSAPILPGDSDNPIFMDNYIGDNANQDYSLTHTPISNAKTHVYINGVKQTITTDYTLTGTSLSFVAAPGTDVVVNVWYETSEDNLN
jgi:hypothetical protein